jgi:MoxR-like ATPase
MSLSFAQTKQMLFACIKAKTTPLILGSPGVGKTSLVRQVAQEVDMPCHELLASNCDAVDIAGLPFIDKGKLHCALLPQI